MKVLVTGAKGQLGHDIMDELAKRNIEGIGVDVEEMDITDAETVRRVITESKADVEKRARSLKRILQNAHLAATIGMEPCESQIGGGSLPLERIPSMAVTIKPGNISVPKLEEEMRHLSMPIIPRTANDTIYLDVRTIESCYFKKIAEMLGELL